MSKYIEFIILPVYNKEKLGDIMETLKIEKLDHQGRGISHLDHKIVFVENALEGEVVKIQILNEKKNFIEAKALEITKKSENRIEAICPYFLECGGCDLLHMNYEKQLEYKENKVKEIMKKFAGLDDVVKPIVSNEEIFGYRNKVVFQVKDGKIGFYKRKSNEIIEIEKCYLIPSRMNEILKILKKMNLMFVKQIMIRSSRKEDMIVLYVEKEFDINSIPQEIVNHTIVLNQNGQKRLENKTFIVEKINQYEFKISPNSFFQVNTKQMEKLYSLVLEKCELTKKERVLDLYCGTGTIGIFVSSLAKEVVGIEINEQAIVDAIENKKRNKVENISFFCGDTGKILKKKQFQPDIIIVDPPRAGLNKEAIEEVLKLHAQKLIYVSCDPVTLARDLKILEKQYEIKEIIPVDMFSNTAHVECICYISRKEKECDKSE